MPLDALELARSTAACDDAAKRSDESLTIGNSYIDQQSKSRDRATLLAQSLQRTDQSFSNGCHSDTKPEGPQLEGAPSEPRSGTGIAAPITGEQLGDGINSIPQNKVRQMRAKFERVKDPRAEGEATKDSSIKGEE